MCIALNVLIACVHCLAINASYMQSNYDIKIVLSASSENISLLSNVMLMHAPSIPLEAKHVASQDILPAVATPQKAKLGCDQFTFTTRMVW